MSYSRRQLYAMGEPLGDSATYRKADGGLVLGDGGGGGGGSGELPEKTVTNIMELPGWARQYAQDTLAKGAALTNIEKNPYQQYGGERTAGFTDLQKQSFANAKNLGPNALSVQGGLNALNAGQNYANQATDPYAMSAYMSPYMNQVVANQMAAANRNYDISAAQQQAQATQAGAFGGGREAVMRAENERARNSALNSIQAQGLQSAFEKAQQAQQFGSTLGLQGAQAATQAGQNVFGQQQAAIGLENQLGGQQQALAQTELSNKYQDFLNRQNYPYQQLSFMSNLIRGTPIGQQSTNQIYQAQPTAAQNIASLGLGAAGIAALSKAADGGLMTSYADGGEIKGYAGDEGSVVSDMHDVSAMARDVASLSDAQLQEIIKRPTTQAEAQAARQEMAFRASMRGGLAGAVPPQMAERMANGGIVAFASGGFNPTYKNKLSDLIEQDNEVTPEERMAGIQAAVPQIQAMYGDSETDKYQKEVDTAAEKLRGEDNIGNANALFAAAEAVVAGPHMGRQVGAALGAYGRAKAQAAKEVRDAQNQLRQSQIALASAKQARKDGLTGKAFELQKIGEDASYRAAQQKISGVEKLADIQSREEVARMQVGATMAAASRPGETERMLAEMDAIRTGKKSYNGLTGEEGLKAYSSAVSSLGEARSPYKFFGPNKDVERNVAVEKALNEQVDVLRMQNELSNPKTSPERKAEITRIIDQKRAALRGAPQAQQMAGTQDGQRAVSKSGRPIIYRNGQWEYE